jgi:hypothetical protein
VLT